MFSVVGLASLSGRLLTAVQYTVLLFLQQPLEAVVECLQNECDQFKRFATLQRTGWRAIPRGCPGRDRAKTTGHHAICRSKHGRRGRIGRQPAPRTPATSHSKLSPHPCVFCSRSVTLKLTWDVCTPQIRHPSPPTEPALYLSKPGKLQQPQHSQPGPEPSHCPGDQPHPPITVLSGLQLKQQWPAAVHTCRWVLLTHTQRPRAVLAYCTHVVVRHMSPLYSRSVQLL